MLVDLTKVSLPYTVDALDILVIVCRDSSTSMITVCVTLISSPLTYSWQMTTSLANWVTLGCALILIKNLEMQWREMLDTWPLN